MAKRNKKRYQSKGNRHPKIPLTGRCFLLHYHETYQDDLQKGDLLFFLHSDTARRNAEEPEYERTGGSGYLKAKIYDGRNWELVVMEELLPQREHHFNKKERPLDTYFRCAEEVSTLKGRDAQRGYRLHYHILPEAVEESDTAPE